MTNFEFSNEFDVLYNSITSNREPDLNDYEKSVFLTKAQDELVKSYFNPKSNKVQEGFDGSERRQIDFSMIVKTGSYSASSFLPATFDGRSNTNKIILDKDIMMILNEFVDVDRRGKNLRLTVAPITYGDYSMLMLKPNKRPTHYQAWRLLYNRGASNSAEIIVGPDDTLIKYVIRYVKRPRPIILSPLEDLTVGGYAGAGSDGTPTTDPSKATTGIECELDPIMHPELLQRAVELCKASYSGDLQSQLLLGQASQTSIGAIQTSK